MKQDPSEVQKSRHDFLFLSQLQDNVDQKEDTQVTALLENAKAYNQKLSGHVPKIAEDQILPYQKQLSIDGQENTPFGSILIPKIDVNLPLYHTASNEALAVGAGHVENTSLPIGGNNSHSSVSAHRGMTTITAFDNLDRVKEGDVFAFSILGDLYAYKVEEVQVVLPEEVDKLRIQQGKDLATLITCTPYGINSHRILVTGARCSVPEDFLETKPDKIQVVTDKRNFPLFIGLMIVAISMGILFYWRQRDKKLALQAEREKQMESADQKDSKRSNQI